MKTIVRRSAVLVAALGLGAALLPAQSASAATLTTSDGAARCEYTTGSGVILAHDLRANGREADCQYRVDNKAWQVLPNRSGAGSVVGERLIGLPGANVTFRACSDTRNPPGLSTGDLCTGFHTQHT